MREIEFRGKRIDNNEGVYGTLILTTAVEEKAYIVDSACHTFDKIDNDGYAEFDWLNAYPVIYETVGQYTGYYETTPDIQKGEKLYEGDIIRMYGGEYHQGYWEFDRVVVIKDFDILFELFESEYVEKLGNIHDNPELLDK